MILIRENIATTQAFSSKTILVTLPLLNIVVIYFLELFAVFSLTLKEDVLGTSV